MIPEVKKVAVIGLGALGAQIALVCASKGYEVTGYDTLGNAVERYLASVAKNEGKAEGKLLIDIKPWLEASGGVVQASSISEAVKEADLVIEAVPEKLSLKLSVWEEMDAAAPSHAILTTNSSSLPVSRLEGATKRAERCLNLHFYQPVMGVNMVDVMGGSITTPEIMDIGLRFVASLGMVPLRVKKELLGFCFNRVWRAIKKEVLYMWAYGFVDHRDIDRAWMIFNKTPYGPFALMDIVGLDVVYDIEMIYYNHSKDPKDHPPPALKEKLDSGELGVKSGKGFYTYPDPEFAKPGFLSPTS